MTNRYKIIASSIIVIGILFTIIGFASGGHWYILKDNSGFYVPNNQTLVPKSYELGTFKNINISNEHADIDILPSDSFSMEVTAFEPTDVTYDVKGDTLTVKSNNNKDNAMTIGFGPFKSPSIKIYVPQDTVLSNITIDSSFGDVNLQSIKYEQFQLDVSYGDISFKKIDAGQTEITSAFGDKSFHQFSSERLIVNSEYGDIDVAGELNGKTTINSSFGDVDLQLSNTKSDIGYDLSTSFGDLTVNNEDYGTKNSQLHDGENQLEVKVTQGDLELSLK
ncbi:DUF4097 family beta strand repeat-containing protein [Solibacillus cecembensis]|uniref:DUF4097 family beta strand repeat-containing protein n=1 Tax=Solibacillus cecembensis TaxID=459347 RepID=UPI003D02ECB8